MPLHMSAPSIARTLRSVRRFAIALGVAALGACDEEGTTTPPPVLVPLGDGTYYMHSANGIALPAEISRRFIGVVDEQTMLDSARIEVVSGGAWRQRYWIRVLHTGVLDRSEVVIDEGTWAVSGNLNLFTSTIRTRTFNVGVDDATRFASDEPMVFYPGAPRVLGIYRTTRPTP